jgi:hypothetical protein
MPEGTEKNHKNAKTGHQVLGTLPPIYQVTQLNVLDLYSRNSQFKSSTVHWLSFFWQKLGMYHIMQILLPPPSISFQFIIHTILLFRLKLKELCA